ncbi:hypothetical protein UFOVP144_39 [uncultured Caudovirales phage]|uniref:Uncharacterized protein n=1 Tax=uncultured Caudovirales phage TaxID=2100421 RepID=A0A6J7XNH4_9CAUD|nr:hypothetical protein UFOVP144_39 [uncultured Caudovirales phage]
MNQLIKDSIAYLESCNEYERSQFDYLMPYEDAINYGVHHSIVYGDGKTEYAVIVKGKEELSDASEDIETVFILKESLDDDDDRQNSRKA